MKNSVPAARRTNVVPHFWVLVIMLDFFILLYNSSFIDITGWFPWGKELMAAQGVTLFVLNFIFLIPIVYASIVFGLRGTLLTWLTFLAGVLPRTLSEVHTMEEALRFALFAVLALFMGLLISLTRNWTLRERAMQKEMAPRRWHSVSKILKAQENERKRIARELHDDTIQDLLVIVNHVHAIESGIHGELSQDVKNQVERIENEMLRVIDSVRKMSRDLRSSVLDNTGLVPALKWLAESLSQESRIKVNVTVNGKEHKIRREAEMLIFRIAQEAISNIRQHSQATEAEITLDFAADDFRMTVHDNGGGFCLPENIGSESATGQLGLDIMKQRTKLLGGRLDIQSELGQGTTITLEADI
ncbi:MAG: sensor histidine kinase [Dehalococcoidia bacterium]|nr:sensor histidine kinase [Dehalococcoidia bacterium]MDD5493839.1 sensor histidine kinase [Dehalococcoidia bacterium]